MKGYTVVEARDAQGKRLQKWSKLLEMLTKHVNNSSKGKHVDRLKTSTKAISEAKTLSEEVAMNLIQLAYMNVKQGNSYR